MKLCDLDTAKDLQELGYTELCMDYYLYGKLNGKNKDGSYYPFALWEDFNTIGVEDLKLPLYSAPRLDDAAYFIRDKFGIFIDIRYTRENIRKDSKRSWAYVLKDKDSEAVQYGDSFYCSYDSALEAAVKEAIEIIKNK